MGAEQRAHATSGLATPERQALVAFLRLVTPLPQTIELRKRVPYTTLCGRLNQTKSEIMSPS